MISGVPQGSVLGPLIYINVLTKISLKEASKLTLYANNVLLFRLINNSPEDFVAFQDDMTGLVYGLALIFLNSIKPNRGTYLFLKKEVHLLHRHIFFWRVTPGLREHI